MYGSTLVVSWSICWLVGYLVTVELVMWQIIELHDVYKVGITLRLEGDLPVTTLM